MTDLVAPPTLGPVVRVTQVQAALATKARAGLCTKDLAALATKARAGLRMTDLVAPPTRGPVARATRALAARAIRALAEAARSVPQSASDTCFRLHDKRL